MRSDASRGVQEKLGPLKFGVHLPTGDVEFQRVRDLAAQAEKLGYDSLWVADHLVQKGRKAMPMSGGLFEPLTTLATLASTTSKTRLGTAILLPLRHPLVVANMIATLDNASKGRVTLGLGVGWMKDEFDALGIPFEERGQIADESIEILKAVWTRNPASYKGKYFHFDDITVNPKPLQKPHPPVWIGGNSTAAVRRAAALGNGWIPTDYTVGEYEKGLKQLKAECTIRKRKIETIAIASHLYMSIAKSHDKAVKAVKFLAKMTGDPITEVEKWSIVGTPTEVQARIKRYADVGVTHHIFSFPRTGREEESYELLATEVIPAFK